MKPGRVCSICASPEIALQCDGLIASGDFTLAQIATTLGISKYVVSRHSRHSVTKLSDAEAEKLPENKLEILFDRCEALYSALAGNGDIRGAGEILKVQTRLATTLAEREESKQQEIDADANDPLKAPSPEYMNWIKNKVHEAYERAVTAGGMIWCPMGCGRPVNPQTIPERIRIYQEAHGHTNSTIAN
jgi:hypothetical protein